MTGIMVNGVDVGELSQVVVVVRPGHPGTTSALLAAAGDMIRACTAREPAFTQDRTGTWTVTAALMRAVPAADRPGTGPHPDIPGSPGQPGGRQTGVDARPEPLERYEARAGIRPPTRRGKVRGVASEVVPGGGLELWHCDHDHAPGVRSCLDLTDAQRADAASCAAAWLRAEIAAARLSDWLVVLDTDG